MSLAWIQKFIYLCRKNKGHEKMDNTIKYDDNRVPGLLVWHTRIYLLL